MQRAQRRRAEQRVSGARLARYLGALRSFGYLGRPMRTPRTPRDSLHCLFWPRAGLACRRWLPLVVAVFSALACLLPNTADAKVHRYSRQPAQQEDRFAPPPYGARARAMARARRARWRAMQTRRPVQAVRPAAPIRRGVMHPVGVKTATPAAKKKAARDPDKEDEDDDDDEDIETVDVPAVAAANREGPETWWGDAWPVWDRVLDSYTARTVRKHTFNTIISHRNNGGFLRSPGSSLFGFDKGALKVLLGLRFGILDQLDIGVVRLNGTFEKFDTYEFDLRWNILSQTKFGVDLGIRAGLDWFSQEGAKDAVGGIGELMFGRLMFNRVYTGFNFLIASSSSGPKKSNIDAQSSAAVQIALDPRLSSGFSWPFEITYGVAGYKLKAPAMTTGPKWVTNRHMFAIVLSNTQYITTDGIVTNSDRFNFRDWVLGFHITREL